MRPALRLPALLLALAATATHAAAQDAGSSRSVDVRGTVVDAATGAPLVGARIEIPEIRRADVAGEDGSFVLRSVPVGDHAVHVSRLGYDALLAVWSVPATPEPITVRLDPDPILLEALHVHVDRLEQRRNGAPASVRAIEGTRLALSTAQDMEQFVYQHSFLSPTDCPSLASFGGCAYLRGRPTRISVVIDESPAIGGLDELRMYRPDEIGLVEIYRGGAHIRVYTNWYLERSARLGHRPQPLLLFR